MTDFKSHSGTAFTAQKAYVRPEEKEDDPTTYAGKVVIETEEMGEITYKPRDVQEVEKKVDGVPTKDDVEVMYPIKHLPEDVKNLIWEVNESEDLTLTATVGEAIQDNGSSSFFISKNNFETIDKQQTVFGPEDETAEEMAEQEVNA